MSEWRSLRVEALSQVTRREGLMGMVAGVGALLNASPSLAAYGEAANVFGKVTDTSGESQSLLLKFDFCFQDSSLWSRRSTHFWCRPNGTLQPSVIFQESLHGIFLIL